MRCIHRNTAKVEIMSLKSFVLRVACVRQPDTRGLSETGDCDRKRKVEARRNFQEQENEKEKPTQNVQSFPENRITLRN